ncbi:Gfo/Idh/MocA family protein [Kibdelosporangium aridum]|uniref:Gfo/Idh/MocA family protein n=1 Tax=Kibdelosporangium aridum TaxID=2030 RepID=UPI000AB52BEC
MTLRVAMVGLGWAARTIWLPRLTAHPGMKVTAVVDTDAKARASYTGSALVLSDPSQIGREMADLLIVAVPNHAHTPVAGALLRRGFPVFLEKPVCLSTAEADELAQAERAGGAVLIAGSAARYREDVRALERVSASVGEVRHVSLAWVRARGVPGTPWFTEHGKAGGGALVDLGWHLLDMALPLLGPGTVEFGQVSGITGHDFVNRGHAKAVWRQEDELPEVPATVEDTVRAFLITADGISVALHASWASHAEYDRTSVEVHGSAGTAALGCTFGFSPNRLNGSTLTVSRDGQTAAVPLDEQAIGAEYDRQVDALPVLLADPTQRGKAIDAARTTIGVIERIYESARDAKGRVACLVT